MNGTGDVVIAVGSQLRSAGWRLLSVSSREQTQHHAKVFMLD